MGIDTNNANNRVALAPPSVSNCPPYPHKHVPIEHIPDETKILPNNIKTRTMRSFQKVTSAFTEYPAKGLQGHKKSTFYEFLTMGSVPYIVGSATFMALFNGMSHWFPNFDKKGARVGGNKLALGVMLFAAAKSLSKNFITKPVKMATGIDTEMPYQKVSYTIPTTKDDTPVPEYEQHYIFESRDFPRYDKLYNIEKGKPRNYYYDEIARKNDLGKNLEASDADVKPIIKDVISRSSTAKSLSTYVWGGVGVALAAQNSWDNFFNAMSRKSWTKVKSNPNENALINIVDKVHNTGKNIWRITESFGRNFVKASKELYKGPEAAKGFEKHAGKGLLAFATTLSVLGALNTIHGAKTIGKEKAVIDPNKKVVVD